MIITRTPFRISFFGGNTDYPAWYRLHGGQVLATTIDKYCYISGRYLPPFFEHRFHIVYSQIEKCASLDHINHPVVREVLRFLNIDRGISLSYDADLPARSGMGSSSAFTVGLLHTLRALHGKTVSKLELAKEGIYIEQELLKESVGCQDQILASYGGFNHIIFDEGGEFFIRPITVSPQRLQELDDHLMLFYTGIQRTAATLTAGYVPELRAKETHMKAIKGMVDEAVAVLSGRSSLSDFGKLLHEAWCAKRAISPAISNARIDAIYHQARQAGAVGGKLLGAGGGGFILFFVPPERQAAVREKLKNFIHVPFSFESAGSAVVFTGAERDYLSEERIRDKQLLKDFLDFDSFQGGGADGQKEAV